MAPNEQEPYGLCLGGPVPCRAYRLFRVDGYADIPLEDHRETWPIRSKRFRRTRCLPMRRATSVRLRTGMSNKGLAASIRTQH